MLRAIFGEPKRIDKGIVLSANKAIAEFCAELRSYCEIKSDECQKFYRIEVWAGGFFDALNELEQSKYCSKQYAKQVHKTTTEAMDEEELNHYQLHMYFYKNAFIRVFSILDKMGYFLNEFLDLHTQKVKPRFSYFTVLRQMHQQKTHQSLEQKLYSMKEKYEYPLKQLRKKRNLEIHSINVEMIDDLMRAHDAFLETKRIENLVENMEHLDQSFEMVCHSLQEVFNYGAKIIHK